jgi:hypothetical protein
VTIPVNPVLRQFVSVTARRFPPSSRYASVGTTTTTQPDGTVVTYLLRRFIPRPENFATLVEHVVVQGERLDGIAARYLGDPEQFYRLCDGNGVMRPAELAEPGTTIRITLPEGIAGPKNA